MGFFFFWIVHCFVDPERHSLRAGTRNSLLLFPKYSHSSIWTWAVTIFVIPGPWPDLQCPRSVCSLDFSALVPQFLLFLMYPSNEGINPFSPETWSSFLVCRRRDVVVTFFIYEEKEVEMISPERRGSGTAFLPLSKLFHFLRHLAWKMGTRSGQCPAIYLCLWVCREHPIFSCRSKRRVCLLMPK